MSITSTPLTVPLQFRFRPDVWKVVPQNIAKFENPLVRGVLHRPSLSIAAGLALTHGAGANCASPLSIAVAEAFCAAGFAVLRFDLAFRRRRAFGPPHPSTAVEDRAAIRAAIDALRSLCSGPLFAGGHSYGGRQASLVSAEDSSCCAGLLLLSYPLHPPNKPAQLRTAHFASLATPAFFVHGTADPFGSVEEMRNAVARIPARTQLVFVERAGHDLNRGKLDIPSLIVDPFRALMA